MENVTFASDIPKYVSCQRLIIHDNGETIYTSFAVKGDAGSDMKKVIGVLRSIGSDGFDYCSYDPLSDHDQSLITKYGLVIHPEYQARMNEYAQERKREAEERVLGMAEELIDEYDNDSVPVELKQDQIKGLLAYASRLRQELQERNKELAERDEEVASTLRYISERFDKY